MARGFAICSHGGRSASVILFSSMARFSSMLPPKCNKTLFLSRSFRRHRLRFFCSCVRAQEPIDVVVYKDVFSRRMAMAGLKPHHRIALGVSGGPDSMALCILTANWKIDGPNGVGKTDGFIDGLLAVVVDHRLRPESRDEAEVVSHRVSEMGIRCEIAHCDWLDGKPKQGHLQEAAREMRYEVLQNVCFQNQIGVLFVAHHADDQAELFILRLSRNSGVLGLAGMPFTSEIFSSKIHYLVENSKYHSILLVRPLIDFWKEDMYKVCQWGKQDWVEDPTNRSQLFARNRIRMSIGNLPSSTLKSELQAVISACRKTRSFVDYICSSLINQSVTIMDQGYAVLDLQNLNPSKLTDVCLSKFIALVLQFISQRQRPIRGNTSKLLLNYIRTIPCKTSLTAAGCYICPAPGSKGTKALVCCSTDCPLPSNTDVFQVHSDDDQRYQLPYDLDQIIADGKSYSDHSVPDASEVPFLDIKSKSVLAEARRLKILSESTYRDVLLLQTEEANRFKSKIGEKSEKVLNIEADNTLYTSDKPVSPGQACYFMKRFLIMWKFGKQREASCETCVGGHDVLVKVRYMVESDWLYLAKLSESTSAGMVQPQTTLCLDNLRLSTQRALQSLKSIPAAARRGLPVLVDHHGLLLSIPTIGFRHCPCLEVSAEFRPRVPLGGGHSSFI